jgi:hypothetical protein
MKHIEADISILVDMIDSLQEPYRENIIHWLRSCSHKPMHDLQTEIMSIINGLSSLEQEYFIHDMRVLLRKATCYFGMQDSRDEQSGRRRKASRGAQVFWTPLD